MRSSYEAFTAWQGRLTTLGNVIKVAVDEGVRHELTPEERGWLLERIASSRELQAVIAKHVHDRAKEFKGHMSFEEVMAWLNRQYDGVCTPAWLEDRVRRIVNTGMTTAVRIGDRMMFDRAKIEALDLVKVKALKPDVDEVDSDEVEEGEDDAHLPPGRCAICNQRRCVCSRRR